MTGLGYQIISCPNTQVPADVVEDDETPPTARDDAGARDEDQEDVPVSLTGRNAEEQIEEEIRTEREDLDDVEDKSSKK